MNIRQLVDRWALALVLTLAACGGSAENSGSGEPDLPAIPDLSNVNLTPQDLPTLPRGKIGNTYNVVPSCEMLDWPLIYKVVGSEFKYKEEYNERYELRGCSSLDGGMSVGQTMVAGTRSDRPGAAPLFNEMKTEQEKQGTASPYTGYLPSGVQECFWMLDYKNHDKNIGMACRDSNNVGVHFLIMRGISKQDSVKLMGSALGRARAYYETYQGK